MGWEKLFAFEKCPLVAEWGAGEGGMSGEGEKWGDQTGGLGRCPGWRSWRPGWGS